LILPNHADPPPLSESADGVIRIAGTRIPLERILRAFLDGSTPEQIVHDYDVLDLEEVYAVISYYLLHRKEVDEYLAVASEDGGKTTQKIQQEFNPTGIRARLLANRPAETQ
jgi:uncharacterized protein (DUF433 family)